MNEPKKKRTELDRKLERYRRLTGAIDGLISQGIREHRPHSWFLEQRTARVYEARDWQRIGGMQSNVNAYFHGAFDVVQRHFLDWCHSVDGVFLTRAEMDAREIKIDAIDPKASRHVWRGTQTPFN